MSYDDIAACAEIVHRADPDRFLAAMAAKPTARDTLFPLYAFNSEVSRAPWVTQEPMIAEMRLQWWRDALEEIQAGETVRRHQVVTPLASVLKPPQTQALDDLIEARRWDIHKDPFEDEAHFERYIQHTSGALLWVAASCLGDAKEGVVQDVGYAMGLANWFRAIPALEAQKRIPLVDGRPETIQALADEGLTKLQAARKMRRDVSRHAGQALLAAWKAEAILEQVRENPLRVGEGSLGISAIHARAGLMWRAFSGRW